MYNYPFKTYTNIFLKQTYVNIYWYYYNIYQQRTKLFEVFVHMLI